MQLDHPDSLLALLAAILVVLAGLVSPATSSGQTTQPVIGSGTPVIELTAAERDWLQAHPDLVFGAGRGAEPGVIPQPDGTLKGIVVDILDLINARLGTDIRIKAGVHTEIIDQVQSGDIDGCLTLVAVSAEEIGLPYTDPYLQIYPTFWARQDLDRQVNRYADLSGLRFALMEESRFIQALLRSHSVAYELVLYPTQRDALWAVAEGEAEVFGEGNFAQYIIDKDGLTKLRIIFIDWDRPGDVVIGTHPELGELVPILNKAIRSISSFEMNTILTRWIPAKALAPPEVLLSPRQQEWLRNHPTIVLGLGNQHEPAFSEQSDGSWEGFVVDIVALIESRLGVQIELRPMPADEMFAAILAGELDGSAALTRVGTKKFDLLSTRPFTQVYTTVYARKDLDRPINSLADLRGLRVAHLEGTQFVVAALEPYADQCDITSYESTRDGLHAVFEGKADVYVGGNYNQYTINKELLTGIGIVFVDWSRPIDALMGIRPDLPELVGILNMGVASISPQELNAILGRWIPAEAIGPGGPTLVDTEREWLREHPVLRVGIDPGWRPIEYADREGRHQGVTADYLRRIEDWLGVELEVVVRPTWEDTLDKVKNREIDLVSCISRTAETSEFLEFTDAFLSLPIVVFTQLDSPYVADLRQLQGRKVAVVEGYAVQRWLLRDHPEIELVLVGSIEESFQMLSQGQVDACLEAVISASTVIGQLGYTNIKVSGETPYHYDLHMAVRKDWPILAGILGKALDAIPEAERSAISQKWTAVRYEQSFDYSKLWKALGVLLAIIVGFVVWNRVLSMQVRRRTRELGSANEELRHSEERYRQLSDLTIEGIVRHYRGVAIDLNQSLARMFGYSRDELIGCNLVDLLIPEEYHALVQEKLELEYTGAYEVEARRKDGSRFVMEIESRETGPDSPRVAAVRDVTERKRAQEALLTRERYLACLSRISLWLLEHMNPDDVLGRAVELLGSTASVSRCSLVKNETFDDTVVGRVRHQWCADTGMDGQDPCEHGELAYASQGLARWTEDLASGQLIASPVSQLPEAERSLLEAEGVQSILIAPLIVTGEWYGFISFEDRTTARIWQQELDLMRIAASEISGAIESAALLHEVRSHASQLADRVAERTAELEAANRELRTFTYSVSHDLRSPLRKIDGFSQILLARYGRHLEQEATEHLQRIRSASQRMGRIIDDLLRLSQLSGQELHREPVDLSAMARSTATELIHASQKTEPELVIADDLTVEADPGLLRQVMQNLLDNALKFTSRHSHPRIEVGATAMNQELVYYVKDNGVGFEEKYADKLFNVFQRLHKESEFEGTGVGLATVLRIIERHGGRIWAEASIGEGATFYFTLHNPAEPEPSGPPLTTGRGNCIDRE
jgi:PAS domain S-box-containing protein